MIISVIPKKEYIVTEIENEIVRKDAAMRKGISSRKNWFQSFTLHISSEPGRVF